MKVRTLQIDVRGTVPGTRDMIDCIIRIGGRDVVIFMTKANYEAMIFDKIFIRDGKERDSAGILNTTRVFVEQ